ncbi:MAG: GNAT family N-acetyltransferase [Pseudomonadota bacterium]
MEVQVALELIDEALLYPEREDYIIYCSVAQDASLTGYICFGQIPLTDFSYDLYWIAVDEQCARKGIGGELMRFMEEYTCKKGGRSIYIDTSSTPEYEAARSLYKRHSYQLMCVLEDFYRPGDHKMIFSKKLSPLL